MTSRFLSTLALILTAALSLSAHHAAAGIDRTASKELKGTIKAFSWQNPHSWMEVDVVGPDGKVVTWTVEMTAPNVLINEGWTRTALQEGDKVTVFVNPLRNAITLNDGSQGGLYVGVVLADGKKLGQTDGTGRGSSQ